MLYEVSDPAAYFVPDVTCDFTGVTLEQIAPDRVLVSGAHGLPPTSTAKVCLTYEDGWRCIALQPIMGIEARPRPHTRRPHCSNAPATCCVPAISATGNAPMSSCWAPRPPNGSRARRGDAREVIARMIVDHDERAGAELFAREQISSITTMSVGTSIGLGTSAAPLLNLFSFLLPKDQVQATMTIDGVSEPVAVPTFGGYEARQSAPETRRRPK